MLNSWLKAQRMPWVPAAEPRDCGASAFATVARHYRYHVTLEQARYLVGTDQNGTTLIGLRDGGRKIGLEARPAQGIYGISTRSLDPHELRQAISAVLQDSRLLQQSIRENITMMGDVALADARYAAQLANADDFIMNMLRGYETAVAPGSLSSGQVQRIALARALLKASPILLLDEATSNLDGATERGILQALATNRRGKTTVVIAHRLSTITLADRIFVMHNGELVETGTHDELWKLQGHYASLFRGQLMTRLVSEETAVNADVSSGSYAKSEM